MMISEELRATWDQEAEHIEMHRSDPTRLQHLAKRFADKVHIHIYFSKLIPYQNILARRGWANFFFRSIHYYLRFFFSS